MLLGLHGRATQGPSQQRCLKVHFPSSVSSLYVHLLLQQGGPKVLHERPGRQELTRHRLTVSGTETWEAPQPSPGATMPSPAAVFAVPQVGAASTLCELRCVERSVSESAEAAERSDYLGLQTASTTRPQVFLTRRNSCTSQQ